jgi:hypothetical protein
MRSRVTLGLMIATSLAFSGPASAEKISHDQLVAMFAQMRAGAPWNIEDALLWGYFFTAKDRTALEPVAEALASQGYTRVAIYAGDQPDADGSGLWWLRMEKVEKHTVESLDARNTEFYALAEKYRGIQYDGMDVGPRP